MRREIRHGVSFCEPLRRPPRLHARVGIVLAAACLALFACREPASGAPQHLLENPAPLTLGSDTRLANAHEAKLLVRKEFEPGDTVPESAPLPAPLAGRGDLLLHYIVWRDGAPRASPARRSVVVPAVTGGAEARVALPGLAAFAGAPPASIEVNALPLGDGAEPLRARVTVPPRAVLDFGYGLREESWLPDAPPVRFRVSTVEKSSPRELLFERTLDPAKEEQRGWRDARVDLSAYAGRTLVLELSATRAAGATGLALPVFADPILYTRGTPSQRPSVLLVSIDTLRAGNLGAYGYARDTSPFFDELATQGTLFENAITTAATTGPSHMSLFTGLYPVHHGLVVGTAWMAPGVQPLARLLRDAGFETAAFTEDGFLIRRRGFGEGFARYVENRKYPDAPRNVRITFEQARRWLEAEPRRPFFLFVHTYEVHTPYAPPERYRGLFAADGRGGPGQRRVRQLRNDYDREIRFVDDELRALFDTLVAVGAANDTLVVITADHGEEFAEHGLFQHGGAVFEESLRVPLLLWGPARIEAGVRLDTAVSLIDVVPTLLDLLGVPAPRSLDGTSLAPLLAGGEGPGLRTLFAEARSPLRYTGPRMVVRWSPPLIAVRSPETKFIVHRPESGPAEPLLAFDLAADPGEAKPLSLDPAEARRVEALVDAYLAGRDRTRPAPEDLDPADREQLRELGYLP